jgi:hypothetical protein
MFPYRNIHKYSLASLAGGWRNSHNEIHNLNALPHIIRVIKSRRMKWVGHVARMGEKINIGNIFVVNHEGRDHLEELGVDVMISDRILGK